MEFFDPMIEYMCMLYLNIFPICERLLTAKGFIIINAFKCRAQKNTITTYVCIFFKFSHYYSNNLPSRRDAVLERICYEAVGSCVVKERVHCLLT